MPCKEFNLNPPLEIIKIDDLEGLRENKAFTYYNESSNGYYVSVTVKYRPPDNRVN